MISGLLARCFLHPEDKGYRFNLLIRAADNKSKGARLFYISSEQSEPKINGTVRLLNLIQCACHSVREGFFSDVCSDPFRLFAELQMSAYLFLVIYLNNRISHLHTTFLLNSIIFLTILYRIAKLMQHIQ